MLVGIGHGKYLHLVHHPLINFVFDVLHGTEIFNFHIIKSIYFFTYSFYFGSLLIISPWKSQRYSPTFSFIWFIILPFTFRVLSHIEFTFESKVKRDLFNVVFLQIVSQSLLANKIMHPISSCCLCYHISTFSKTSFLLCSTGFLVGFHREPCFY